MYDSTLSTLHNTGLPVLIWDEIKQVGINCNDRLAHAFQSAFDQGFDNVIAVGSDSPKLSGKHLMRAVRLLNQNKLAIGKSVDGGLFLLGMQKNQFDHNAFLNLNWETRNLYYSFRTYFQRFNIGWGSVGLLDDLDNMHQFVRFLCTHSVRWLQMLITPIKWQAEYAHDDPIVFFRLKLIKNKHYKAPPFNL